MLNAIIALGACVLALLYGGVEGIELYSIDTTLDVTFYSIGVHVDPVFIVWADPPAAAMTFGNTIIASEWLRDDPRREWILEYEMNHVRQCRALGWMMWPAALFVDMDPFRGAHPTAPEWDRPAQADELMWLPPDGWRDQWHWFTIEARFG